jgi:hypothetical protein
MSQRFAKMLPALKNTVGRRAGLEAWEIAVALRRRHGVDAVELIWNFIDSMQVALRSAERSKKEAAESRAALFNAGEVTPVLERVSDA